MTAAGAFFIPDGNRFLATDLTRGPWSNAHQHGGPPAALMARAIERFGLDGSAQVARMSVEFIKPVPIGALRVETSVVRRGRTVQLLCAALLSGHEEVCRGTALCVHKTSIDLESPPGGGSPRRLPDDCAPCEFDVFAEPGGYGTAVEVRLAMGAVGAGPTTAWIRMKYPLVAGEEPSPLERVMVAADSGNGVSMILDPRRYTFVNADLTAYLHRMPEGEWVCLDAATALQPSGVGLAESGLYDVHGPIGRSLQSLIVRHRPTGGGRSVDRTP